MKPRIYYSNRKWRVAPFQQRSISSDDWFHAWIFCDHMNLGHHR